MSYLDFHSELYQSLDNMATFTIYYKVDRWDEGKSYSIGPLGIMT